MALTKFFGKTYNGTEALLDPNRLYSMRVQSAVNGYLKQLRFWAMASGANILGGVHEDSGGIPGNLLASGGPTTSTDGTNTIVSLNLAITANSYYHICGLSSASGGLARANDSGGGSCRYKSASYSSGIPNPAGTGFINYTVNEWLIDGYGYEPPTITADTVGGDISYNSIGVGVTVTNGEPSAGTNGHYWLTNNAVWGSETIKVQQDVTTWVDDGTGYFNVVPGTLETGTVYLWIETDSGQINSGYSFDFTEYTANIIDNLNYGSYSSEGLSISTELVILDIVDSLNTGTYSTTGLSIVSLISRIDTLETGIYSSSGLDIVNNGTAIPNAQTPLVTININGVNYSGYSVSGTWTLANSPYYINNNIYVEKGNTLEIEAGVEVIFTGRYWMRILGGTSAVGTPENMIVFRTSDEDIALGNSWVGWKGIRIPGADYNQSFIDHGVGIYNFQYCDISYVDKVGGVSSHPWEDYEGCFYCLGTSNTDLIFNNNRIHTWRTGGLSYFDAASSPMTGSFHLVDNVIEDGSVFSAYLINHADNFPVYIDGGRVENITNPFHASVAYVFDSGLILTNVEIVNCDTPYFVEFAEGTITYNYESQLSEGTYNYTLSSIVDSLSNVYNLESLNYSYDGLNTNALLSRQDNLTSGIFSYSGLTTSDALNRVNQLSGLDYSFILSNIYSTLSLLDSPSGLSFSISGLNVNTQYNQLNITEDNLSPLSYSLTLTDLNTIRNYVSFPQSITYNYSLNNIISLLGISTNLGIGSYALSAADITTLQSYVSKINNIQYSYSIQNLNTLFSLVSKLDNISLSYSGLNISTTESILSTLGIGSYSYISTDISSLLNKLDNVNSLQYSYTVSDINTFIWSNKNNLSPGIYSFSIINLPVSYGSSIWNNILYILNANTNNMLKLNNIDKDNIIGILDIEI